MFKQFDDNIILINTIRLANYIFINNLAQINGYIMDEVSHLTPQKAAIRLNKILETFHLIHGGDKFPIDIDKLILDAAEIFNWPDPVTEIQGVDIKSFEGMLFSNDEKTKWKIIYNSTITSSGRIRFTKAHELGHYILHRKLKSEFECKKNDMLSSISDNNIESEADLFASYLLMPLDDFRQQINDSVNLEILTSCSSRYGVSLTASILKWLSYTKDKAVFIMSIDGYMLWSSPSDSAFKSGAFFKTRQSKEPIPIPKKSLTANNTNSDLIGVQLPAKIWFPHVDSDSNLTEMKIHSTQYDCTLTLLILPKYADFWPRN